MLPLNEPIESVNKMTPLIFCAAYSDDSCMKVLIGAGADPEERDSSGLTVLHHACKTQNTRVLQYLLNSPEFAALRHVRTNGGLTPLMLAVQGKSLHFVAECLNAHMNPFDEDYLGFSVMFYAQMHKEKRSPNIYEGIC